jgi:hypothetical protein
MTKKSLILGVVTLCALPAAAFAQVLINENFDELTPGAVPNGTMINAFTYTNVSINGNINGAHAPAACTIFANPNNCANFNGVSGVLTSKSLSLAPGDYVLSYDVAKATATSATSTLTGTLAGFSVATTLSPGHVADISRGLIVTTPETVTLRFAASGPGGNGGISLDNIFLASAPEPATLGLLALGLLGGAVAGFARRKRRN